jgi:hypothetical protein
VTPFVLTGIEDRPAVLGVFGDFSADISGPQFAATKRVGRRLLSRDRQGRAMDPLAGVAEGLAFELEHPAKLCAITQRGIELGGHGRVSGEVDEHG